MHLISPDNVLRHPARRKVVEHLAERPATVTELKERTGLRHSTLCYHLTTLKRHGLVHHRRHNKFSVYALAGRSLAEEDVLAAPLRREVKGDVLRMMSWYGSVHNDEVCDQFGLAESTASYHLRHLVKEGLAEHQRSLYSPTAKGLKVYELLVGSLDGLPARRDAGPARGERELAAAAK